MQFGDDLEPNEVLTIVMQAMIETLRDQSREVDVSRHIAGQWERRAILGATTLANELGLRVREAESRERTLRRQLEELVSLDVAGDEIRHRLARLLRA